MVIDVDGDGGYIWMGSAKRAWYCILYVQCISGMRQTDYEPPNSRIPAFAHQNEMKSIIQGKFFAKLNIQRALPATLAKPRLPCFPGCLYASMPL